MAHEGKGMDGEAAFKNAAKLDVYIQDRWYKFHSDDKVNELLRLAQNNSHYWLILDFMATAWSFEDLVKQCHQKIDYITDTVLPSQQYYVGICACPEHRFIGGWRDGRHTPGHRHKWRNMFVLMVHDGPVIGQLEVAMLDKHLQEKDRCTNIKPGNEGHCPTGVQSFLYLAIDAVKNGSVSSPKRRKMAR